MGRVWLLVIPAALEMRRIWTEIEGQMATRRRFYNTAVNRLSSAIQVFPGAALPGMAGVTAMPFFEAPAQARIVSDADTILGRQRS